MSNDKKQTAVEWLINKIEDHFCLLPVDLIDQAKAMEEEQIIESIISTIVGSNKIYDKEYPEVRQVAEQYYNETYGDDK
jgi:hypothetical protein